MATSFTAPVDGGEQVIEDVGTTWVEVRMPFRTRRVTATFGAAGFLGRGQEEEGEVSGHAEIVADSPYEVFLGPPSHAELILGYRPVYLAVTAGTADVHVRSEVV